MNYNRFGHLNAGDEVIRVGLQGFERIVTVNRVTPSLIIIGSDKYRRLDGRLTRGYIDSHLKLMPETTP